jgi:hypothetical protein
MSQLLHEVQRLQLLQQNMLSSSTTNDVEEAADDSTLETTISVMNSPASQHQQQPRHSSKEEPNGGSYQEEFTEEELNEYDGQTETEMNEQQEKLDRRKHRAQQMQQQQQQAQKEGVQDSSPTSPSKDLIDRYIQKNVYYYNHMRDTKVRFTRETYDIVYRTFEADGDTEGMQEVLELQQQDLQAAKERRQQLKQRTIRQSFKYKQRSEQGRTIIS